MLGQFLTWLSHLSALHLLRITLLNSSLSIRLSYIARKNAYFTQIKSVSGLKSSNCLSTHCTNTIRDCISCFHQPRKKKLLTRKVGFTDAEHQNVGNVSSKTCTHEFHEKIRGRISFKTDLHECRHAVQESESFNSSSSTTSTHCRYTLIYSH